MEEVSSEIVQRETHRVTFQNDRAKLLGLNATLTVTEWLQTLDHFQWTCAYCSGPYEVLEHFIPLNLQGETSIFNCLPACYACNARKSGIHPGGVSWIAPATLLYIRSYFLALHTGTPVVPLYRDAVTSIERPDAIYTIRDLVARFQLSERTIRRMVASEEIPGTLIHGVWRFSDADIKRFIDSKRIPRREKTTKVKKQSMSEDE